MKSTHLPEGDTSVRVFNHRSTAVRAVLFELWSMQLRKVPKLHVVLDVELIEQKSDL